MVISISIITPSKNEVGNVRSYFSGHYQTNGCNVQAACDAHLWFTFIGLAGPGVMPNRDALKECALHGLIEQLLLGYVPIGDAAYAATEHLASIYFGDASKITKYNNYNYFASQCRIRIEMAFGMMTTMWRILQKPLRLKVSRIKYILLAIAKLHNYCINERISRGNLQTEDQEEFALFHTSSTPHKKDNTPVDDQAAVDYLYSSFECLSGQSLTRERMVMRILDMNLERPTSSVLSHHQTTQRQQTSPR
jgi:DDE superfamily endonuclease